MVEKQDLINAMAFHKAELIINSHKDTYFSNKAHEHILQFEKRYYYINFKLSDDKTFVTFDNDESLEQFKKHWKHYLRVVY